MIRKKRSSICLYNDTDDVKKSFHFEHFSLLIFF